MPKVICKKVRCNTLVDKGKNFGYCDEHRSFGEHKIKEEKKLRYSDYDKRRDPRTVSFYHGTKWKNLREHILVRDNYLCQDCLSRERLVAAEEVHHIIEVKEDWDKRYGEDNLVSLCKSCHRRRHRKY